MVSTPTPTLDPAEEAMISAAFSLVREAVVQGRLSEDAVLAEARFAADGPDEPETVRERFNATAMRFAVGPPLG